jgi:cyclophilin family peptidyl-prolyl cis-trans isomerase
MANSGPNTNGSQFFMAGMLTLDQHIRVGCGEPCCCGRYAGWMKIKLNLNICAADGKVEAARTIEADNLSSLPIPVPNIGERIGFSAHGELYRGTVKDKQIEMIDDPGSGVLTVTVWADLES